MPPAARTEDRLPALSLLNRIAAMGGARELPSLRMPYSDPDDPERTEDQARRLWRLEWHIKVARKQGWLSMFVVDEICCDYLSLHPFEVYGEEWYAAGKPSTAGSDRWVDRFVNQQPILQAVA